MKLNYELNPPKIAKDGTFSFLSLKEDLYRFQSRAELLDGLVENIHLTDSVLGVPRISGIAAASHLKSNGKLHSTGLTCSLRTQDRSLLSICQSVADAILLGIRGVLIVAGDDPKHKATYSVTMPSKIVKMLHTMRYDEEIEIELAIPNHIKQLSSIQGKIDARPNAFVTQSIESLEALARIVDIAHENKIRVIACVMIPCKKNEPSARIIGLNWAQYKDNPIEFVKEAGALAEEVLLTSPNNFNAGLQLLEQLNK
jgi:5,10-methylenetetrahydrofolate reductase